jgi:hypothetical protein
MRNSAARGSRIDLEFAAGGGQLRARVLERPGLWLDPPALAHLVGQLRTVVGSLGIGDLPYGVLSGEKRWLDRLILTLIEDRRTGAPVAFNAMLALECTLRGAEVDVVHLGLTAVDPAYRSRGLSWILTGFTSFLLFVKHGFRPYWISNVSQVPSVIGMVAEGASHVYPSPFPGARRGFDHVVLARELMQRHRDAFGVGPDATFDDERFVILDAYTGGSDHLKKRFEDAPRHRDERANELCRRELDYGRGDDFLQLGQVDLFSFWRWLSHSLPRYAWAVALTRFGFVLANALLLPVLRWLTPDSPMGELRPVRKSRG